MSVSKDHLDIFSADPAFLLALAEAVNWGPQTVDQYDPTIVAKLWDQPKEVIVKLYKEVRNNKSFREWLNSESVELSCETWCEKNDINPRKITLFNPPNGRGKKANLTTGDFDVVRNLTTDEVLTTDNVVRCGKNDVVRQNLTTDTGTITIKYQKCGKKGCRCNNGNLHGPYIWRRSKVNGKEIWKYQGKYVGDKL